MSVGFATAVAEGLRYNGVEVSFQDGWETRGNGQTFPNGRPRGLLTHHTGSDYGTGLSVLTLGRPDLDPPLCNCCTYPDGRVHIIAAHVANHAGASGGRSMGPLPTTTLFNRLMWGNEIMFPGVTPMTAAQYRSACVLAGVVCGILGYVTAEYCRLHAETSITGKWDCGAGKGPGIPLDGAQFRRDIWPHLTAPLPSYVEDDVVQNHRVTGTGLLPLICPVGPTSAVTSEAWVSAVVDGPAPGKVRYWFQNDTAGVSDTVKDIPFKDGRSGRAVVVVPPGTTMIRVAHEFPQGGTVCLETRPKPLPA